MSLYIYETESFDHLPRLSSLNTMINDACADFAADHKPFLTEFMIYAMNCSVVATTTATTKNARVIAISTAITSAFSASPILLVAPGLRPVPRQSNL